jgi:predicted nucleic acid-binding protein
MNVLIDTNVILDILLRREPYYEDAANLIAV